MAFDVSVRALRGARPGVLPQTGGGYARADMPDPNDPSAAYARRFGSAPMGASALMSPLPTPNAFGPTITPSGESAHSANLTLAQADRDASAQYQGGEVSRRAAAGNTGSAAWAPLTSAPSDPRFAALFQALAQSGASKLSTTAAGGGHRGGVQSSDAPGFFDLQNPSSQVQQQRSDYLRGTDVNRLMDAIRQQRGVR